MKTVIVTGATSMIGCELVKQLCPNTFVYAVIRKNSSNKSRLCENKNIKVIELNIDEYDQIATLINSSIDAVFHLAWEGARNPYRNDAVMQKANYIATINLFNAALKLGVKKFIGVGSQAEYGSYSIPFNERLKCHPTTEYGKYKLEAYQTIKEQAKLNKICFIWTRVFSAYGQYDYDKSLIMSVIKSMKENQNVNVSPCEHIWNFTYYKDIVKGLKLFYNNDIQSGLYNLSSNDNRKLKEFIEEIKIILKSSSAINYGYYKYSDDQLPHMIVDSKKIEDLGFSCDYTFEKGLKELLSL